MKKNIFFSIALVLAVSGCVNFGDTGKASVETTNIVTMQPASVSVIPKPPVSTDTDFTVTFEIKNQDKTKSVDVDMNLFDWGVCKSPEISCAPALNSGSKQCETFSLVPQQTELIEIKATTPSREEIGGIAASCPIQWRAQYKFSTVSNAGFNVVSRSKLTESQRANKPLEVPAVSSNIGSGPLKAFISFSTTENFVTAKSPIQMSVQVKDQGEGTFNEIPAGALSIIVPKEWYIALLDEKQEFEVRSACTGKFEPDESLGDLRANTNLKTATFKNIDKILLINRETPPQVCNLKAPDLDTENIPQKSYQVSAKISDYTYTLDGKQVVDVKP